jgi:kynureninase
MPAMALPEGRDDALALDAADELAAIRDEFLLPEGVVYLDGNSLGPLPRLTVGRLQDVVRREWGGDLIRSWDVHGWMALPLAVGAAIAPLIGARDDEVAVADSTSVNLFKLLAAALRLRPGRTVVLSEQQNFPTDLYMAQGLADLLGDRVALKVVDRRELDAALDGTVAVLALTEVDFRTGERHDLAARTAAAHRAGALALWDLSHSAGALPVDLNGCGADLAVGCGYKFLNGGPGAPAFAFVAHRLQAQLRPPLWGWLGHAEPFEFSGDYRPAPGIARLLCGTPPILSLAALACGVDVVTRAGIDRLYRKSLALTELFIGLVDRECAGCGLELASPRKGERRGAQVSYRHPEGKAIVGALLRDGVIADFRPPDLLRFGFSPAFLRFADVWDAAARLRRIMEGQGRNRAGG